VPASLLDGAYLLQSSPCSSYHAQRSTTPHWRVWVDCKPLKSFVAWLRFFGGKMGRGTTRSQSSRLRDIGSTYRLTATREGQSRPNRSPKGVGRNHVI